jgi:toluene monooxygenase system ferredoxin subunit
MSFVEAATLDDVWIGEKVGVVVHGKPILLVNVEGTIRAFEDRCCHKGVPLSSGTLQGHVLTCGVHGWAYDARSGAGINPERVSLLCFPVRIEGNAIWVDVEEEGLGARS